LATYSTKTVNRRLNVLYSIAKQGGKEEYRNYVNSVVEQWPAILTYQPARLRVLARIAFNSLDYDSMEELTLSNITNIVIPNLEATLAGYLENKADIQAPSDLHNLSKKYKHFGNQALKSIIKQYSEDPAAKVYLRNFKIN
jgi:chromosome segregation and condensation protein ScpB